MMLTTLVLAFLPSFPGSAFSQEKASVQAAPAPLASERRELAEIRLLLGAERKYVEAQERLERLKETLEGRTEAGASELLAEVERVESGVRRALGEAVPADLADAGQDKIDAAVAAAIERQDFAFVRALGKRAVPGLLAAVRADVERLASEKDDDPLTVLAGIDPLALSQLASELLEEPSFFWKKRVLRVLDADLADRGELWEAGERFLGDGLVKTAEKYVGDPDVGQAAFLFLAGLARHGVRSNGLEPALLGELRSRDYYRRQEARDRAKNFLAWVVGPAPFVTLLGEADPELRDFAGEILVERHGDERFRAERSLLRHAEDESPMVRRRVVDWLRATEPEWEPEERRLLAALLWDPDLDVRSGAWDVLVSMQSVERNSPVPATDFLLRPNRIQIRVYTAPLADEVYRSLLRADAYGRAKLADVATALPQPLGYELLAVLAGDAEASVVNALASKLHQSSALVDPQGALRIAGALLDNPLLADDTPVLRFVAGLARTRPGLEALVRWAVARTDEAPVRCLIDLANSTQSFFRHLSEVDPPLATAGLARLFAYRATPVMQAFSGEKLSWTPALASELVTLAADRGQPIVLRVLALGESLRQAAVTDEHRAIARGFLEDPVWRDWKGAESAWESLDDLLEKRSWGLTNPTILAALRDESVPSELTGRLAANLRAEEEGAAEIVQAVIRHRSDEEAWRDALYQVVWAMGKVPTLQDTEFLTRAVREGPLAAAAFQVLGQLSDPRYLPVLAEIVARPADPLELERATEALTGYLDEGAVEPLLAAAAKVQKPEVRDAALAHLEKIREYADAKERWATRKAKAQTREQVVAALVAQLSSRSDEVKVQAIRALATWEAVEVMPRLIELTTSGSKAVAAAARAALERLNAPKGE